MVFVGDDDLAADPCRTGLLGRRPCRLQKQRVGISKGRWLMVFQCGSAAARTAYRSNMGSRGPKS